MWGGFFLYLLRIMHLLIYSEVIFSMLKGLICIILILAVNFGSTVSANQYAGIIESISDSILSSAENTSELSPLVLQLSDKNRQKEFLRKFKENPQELRTAMDFARAALQLTAVGKNAKPYIDEAVNSPSLGSAEEAAWSLLAVNSANYDLPKDAVWNREKLVSYMLSEQLTDGGFSSAGGQFDVNTTAVVISALAPFQEDSQEVRQAVDKAVQRLSEAQSVDGGFLSQGVLSGDSLASVITALSKIGIDANTDSRFVKEGKGLVDLLLGYRSEDSLSGEAVSDGNAAEALAAYELFKSDKGIYEFKKLNFFQKLFGNFTVIRNSNGEPKKSFIQKIVEFVFKIKPKSRINDDYSNAASEGIGFASVSLTVGETVMFQSEQFQVNKGDTAFSVFVRVTALNGMTAVWDGDFPNVYVKSAGGFSGNGEKRWHFLVNGEQLSGTPAQYPVNSGDKVDWIFK